MRYEYAPQSRIEKQILASADINSGDGWEPWRAEAATEGEMWYRRPIAGTEDEPELDEEFEEPPPLINATDSADDGCIDCLVNYVNERGVEVTAAVQIPRQYILGDGA